jgi:hypothetical protein
MLGDLAELSKLPREINPGYKGAMIKNNPEQARSDKTGPEIEILYRHDSTWI